MNRIVLFILVFVSFVFSKAQAQVPANNSCFSPVTITPGASCNVTAGTTTNATQSYAGCSGNADDDVWYTFVATTTTAYITVYPSSGFDAVIGLHGSCTAASLACRDINPAGVAETMTYSTLTIGNTYLVRVYHFGAGAGTGNFNICITTGSAPAAPSNNTCAAAIALNVNPVCSSTSGTTFGANESFVSGCGTGNADDDVWYSFVATAATNTITVTPSSGFDAVIELHDYCTATNMSCADANPAGSTESLVASSLTPGATYVVRVYHYGVGAGSGAFSICVTGPSAPGVPINDEPCGAIALPVVTANCNYVTYSNGFATETSTALAPAPSSCTGGSADGGYSTDVIEDVWFSVVVPSTGLIHVQAYPSVSGNFVTDGAMALYTGACGSLTQVACSDDNNYPGSTYDNLPILRVSSLTPGDIVYIRYWASGATDPGDFGLCVTTATNDACSTALYVCDLNGYSATTSSAYTVDRPSNMRGNAEVAGTYAYTPGTDQSGVFGSDPPQAGSTGAPNFDVQIDNNSWVRFTAGATAATFTVTIGNCWTNKGVQMQIFSANNCTNFAAVSDFREGTGSYTLSAQGLVPYQDYYLMVDGWGGDICNYTIAALSGVLFPEITASSVAVCANTPVLLTGPTGASSYTWNTGATTPTITVNPSATTTYSLTVTGVCGATQNLTKTVTVNTTPDITSTSSATAICSGNTMSHALTANVSSTYSWAAIDNLNVTGDGSGSSSTINNTLTNTTLVDQVVVYNVTPTSVTGNCPGPAETVSVTVHPRPTLTDPTDISVCSGDAIPATTFTTNPGGASFTWIASNSSTVQGLGTSGTGNISGNAQTVASTTSTNFTVTPTSADGCSGSVQTFSLTVKPKPVIAAVSNGVYCGNSTVPAIAFTASPTTSVNWTSSGTNTGLSIANGIGSTPSFTSANVTSVTTSTITLDASLNGCNANQGQYTITVNPLPQLTGAPSVVQSACGLATGALNNISVTGTGALSYSWTNSSNAVVGGNSNSISNQPAGSYNVSVTDNFNCPVTFGPFAITNPGAPAVPTVLANDNALCVGESLSLTGSSSAANPTYVWSGPNASSSSNTLAIGSVTLADAGTYTLTITESNCTSSNTINIAVNANPIAAATSSNPTYCSGNAINLFGSGGVSYAWTGPNTFSSTNQNPSLVSVTTGASGTYSLTVTDGNNCTAQSTVAIVVNQTPTDPLTTGSSSAVCEGSTINLVAASTNATSYTWIGPNVFVSSNQNPTIPNAGEVNEGVYTVIASGSGCNSNPVLVNVIVNPNPTVTMGVSANPLCSGQNVTLTASGANTIVWDYLTTNGGTLQLNNVQVSNTDYYAVEITDANGCKDRDSLLLTINQTPGQPLLDVAADTVLCEGEDLSLLVSSSGATSFNWTGPNGFASTTANASINNVINADGGIYSISASTPYCTSLVRDIFVTVNDTTTAYASASASIICSGNTISLIGIGGNAASWTGPNGFTSTNSNETIINATTAASGTYVYTSINNPGNCTDTASVTVTVNQTPAAPSALGASTCTGANLNLTANATGTINWYSDSTLTTLVSTSNTYSPTMATNTVDTFYVAASSNGCLSSVQSVIASNYTIVAAISASPDSGSVPLPVVFTNNSIGVDANDTYLWLFNSTTFATTQNAAYQFEQGGSYNVMMVATDNQSGCADTAYVTIFVDDEIRVVIPNIFTPNGDGTNDTFTLDIKGAKEAHGIIYNRWGSLLHEWDAINTTWDGKVSNGQSVSDGVYFYIIKIEGYNGKKLDVPGNVTIIK